MNPDLRWPLTAILIVMGAGWGLTQPLMKITVTAGYAPLGIVFWQLLIGAVALAVLQMRRAARLRLTRGALAIWIFVALVGTILPNSASFRAMAHMPAGLMSIILSTIPLMAFPIAMALGTDQFNWRRLAGIVAGLIGVALIALPEASLPDRAMLAFLPIALVAPLCYAIEGNIVAKFGTAGLDPIAVLFGASALGAGLALPLALGTGQFFVPTFPPGLPEWSLLASCLIHVVVYVTYVWMVGRAGAVFAGQVSYLVTGFGVLWAMLLLGERYSGWVWAALAAMFVGLTLVQPRQKVASPAPKGETGTKDATGTHD